MGSGSTSLGCADTCGLWPGRRSLSPSASLKPRLRPARHPPRPRFHPTAGSPPPWRSVAESRAREECAVRPVPAPGLASPRSRATVAMASEELASKLQRRLQWEEMEEGGPQPEPRAAPVPEPQPQPPARAPIARADAELSVQLNRRLDINEGAARPRRCKVFHPYSEFPEFSRRLIKDLESMFKL